MNLIDILEKHTKLIRSQIYKINHGGCCVFASMIAEQLQHIVPTSITVLDDVTEISLDDARPYTNKNTIREWQINGVEFDHIIVEFVYNDNTYFLDSNGPKLKDTFNTHDDTIVEGHLTIEEATSLAADDNWWPEFNRKHIPLMQRLINNLFVELNNSL